MIANASRYQPGGDLYAEINTKFGNQAANAAAAAARVDDQGETLRFTLSNIRGGNYTVGAANPRTSTAGLFFEQITTDPLAAPLEGLDNQLGNVVLNLIKNPLVLALIVGAVWWKWFRK